jgi:hypothetical protein
MGLPANKERAASPARSFDFAWDDKRTSLTVEMAKGKTVRRVVSSLHRRLREARIVFSGKRMGLPISMKERMMVLYRMREPWFVLTAIAAIGIFVLGASVAGNAGRPEQPMQVPTARGPTVLGSNERLRELMTERYEILKSMVASLEVFFNSGRIDLPEWRDANVALFKAKADLAANASEQIKIYEEMVDFLRTCEQKARQRADAGRMTEADVQRARLATIEAQIALEKLRMGRPQ